MATAREDKPKVGLLMGDPSGIGPELAAKVLADAHADDAVQLVVIGDERILQRHLNVLGFRLDLQVCERLADFDFGQSAIPFLRVPVPAIDLDALPIGTASPENARHRQGMLLRGQM